MLDAALARGIVEKRGSWLAFGDRQLGQGTLAAIEFLKVNPELRDEIAARVKASPAVPAAKGRKAA